MKCETFIMAPPKLVFARVADIPRWAERIGAITNIEMLSSGPVRVGTRFRETRVMFGREAQEEMEVAVFDPPRSLVLTAENHGVRYRTTHTFEPVEGGTRLAKAFTGTPATVAARLLAPVGWLMTASVKRAIDGDLADLKAAIEAEAPGPGR